MELYNARVGRTTDEHGLGDSTDIDALLRRYAIPDRAPFVLDDEMRVVEPVSTFLTEMSADVGERTRQEYGIDLFALMTFLGAQGTDLIAAEKHHLKAYKQHRTQHQDTPVSKATWRRNRTVIEKFFEWALAEGHRADLPYRKLSSNRGGTTSLAQRGYDEPDIRHLTVEQWQHFRTVGLAGSRPDGSFDPAFRGTSVQRNTVAAEVALSTGMRMTEWSSLLDIEVPRPGGGDASTTVRLQECAKGGRARSVPLRDHVVRRVDLYRRTERAAVIAGISRPLSARTRDLFVVTNIDHVQQKATGRLAGRSRTFKWSAMSPNLRRIAVTEGDTGLEPMALFLGERGRMLDRSRWCSVFAAASARAREASRSEGGPVMPTRITSHDLRHTFSVMMLTALTLAVIEREEGDRGTPGAFHRHISLNPLLRLKDLLGHANVSSTYIYLRYVQDTDALVQDAFERWYDAGWRFDEPDPATVR